jgi:predicted nucleic acid-binding protein
VILVDTSIWIEHLRHGLPDLAARLDAAMVLSHPMVIGELALGNLRQRALVLASLRDLPMASVATAEEVLAFIGRHRLFGLGIGYMDVHLLAATQLSPGTRLWTGDRRLQAAAERLGVAVS